LVLHYALIIYHSEHDDYRKRSRDAIEWLIQYYYRLTGRKIKYATMNDKVSKAINAENIDEYDDWVQDVIRERRKRAPPCLNK